MEQRRGPKDLTNRRGIERRKFPRLEVYFKVTLAFKEGRTEGVGTLINLSMGGCSIETTTRVQEGAFLDLTLQLPGGVQTIRSEAARVRWTRLGAFGVEFYKMDKEDQAKLGLLLQEVESQTSLPPPSRDPGRRPPRANPSLKDVGGKTEVEAWRQLSFGDLTVKEILSLARYNFTAVFVCLLVFAVPYALFVAWILA